MKPKNTFKQAVIDTFPIAMGYIPLSIAYALLISNAGLPWYWAIFMSITVYAGALQFFAANMIMMGMPLLEVATTTLIINFRHIFYGLSFPMQSLHSPIKRLYGMFALTDETYSLLASKNNLKLSEQYVFTVQWLNQSYWIIGTIMGLTLDFIIKQPIDGIEFVLTALFIVLAQEHFYRNTARRAMFYGLVASAISFLIIPQEFLSIAIALFLVMLFVDFKMKK